MLSVASLFTLKDLRQYLLQVDFCCWFVAVKLLSLFEIFPTRVEE